MKFITIIGPQAVGKMTVGQELEKITELKLFHNHMSIDYVSNFFSYATKSGKKLVETIRKETFKEIAKSDLDGVIFTYLCNFDDESDWGKLKEFCKIFEQENADIYFVELEAELSKRLERNITPNRLNCKPFKRDIERSNTELIETNSKFRLNSYQGQIKEKNYIKIYNEDLSAKEVASIIKGKFEF